MSMLAVGMLAAVLRLAWRQPAAWLRVTATIVANKLIINKQFFQGAMALKYLPIASTCYSSCLIEVGDYYSPPWCVENIFGFNLSW